MDKDTVDRLVKRYEEDKKKRDLWIDLWDEIYDYALPQRQGFHEESPGQRRTEKIYDSTAVVGTAEFASRIQAGLTPPFSKWIHLQPGSDVPDDEKDAVAVALKEIEDDVHAVILNSSFAQEAAEFYMDLAVGTATMLVEEGDLDRPVKFTTIPQRDVVLGFGPDGAVDAVHRRHKIRFGQLRQMWPRAKVPAELKGTDENSELEFLECTWRDWSQPVETHLHAVVHLGTKSPILTGRFRGAFSGPFVTARWSKVSGEGYGRGPLVQVLPDIKTANLMVELTLENAELAVSGLWQYDDDGVLNVDTISLRPGTFIPRAPGSQGVQPLQSPARFDVSQIVLEDLRFAIKKALYNEQLGPREGTPPTAREVVERMADLARNIGAAFGRLQTEFVERVVRRVLHIRVRQGAISLPRIDGRVVKIQSVSPLANAQALEEVANLDRALEMIAMRWGPQQALMEVNPQRGARFVFERMRIDPQILNSQGERQQLAQFLQQTMAQQNAPAEG